MNARLVCIDPLCPEEDVVLDHFPVVVGRGPDADVRLHDRWVSRVHCVLDAVDDTLVVRDAGSRHGTLVNGMPVEESPLQPGDTVCLGISTFRVDYDRCGGIPSPGSAVRVRGRSRQSR